MTETTENINQQIVHVPFNGQTVDAVAGDNQNTYFVALKPICKNIGVEYSAQYRRLNRQPWATIAMMAIVGDDGKTQRKNELALDYVEPHYIICGTTYKEVK